VLRAYALDDPDPVRVLARLNRYLTDTGDDDTFATTVVALYDPCTGRLRVANAGHPAPLVISFDREGDAVTALFESAGPAVGVLPAAMFSEHDVYLAPGAAFCAYTDGLIDRHSDPTSGDTQRLQRVAAEAFARLTGDDPDCTPVADLLAETIVRGMLGGAAPDEDICLAVLRPAPA
jgi:serine phosphatase RsbU (regulator of sigma subunit)